MWCVGVFGVEEASVLTTLGLHSLQHRGQEGAGIVSCDQGSVFIQFEKKGWLAIILMMQIQFQNCQEIRPLGMFGGDTTGDSKLENIQPFFANLATGGFACAHNGEFNQYFRIKAIGL